MNFELDTPSTPARQPRAWLLGSLGIVTSLLLSAAYAGFVNLRGLTALDMGLINVCFMGSLLLPLAIWNPRKGRTSEQKLTRLGLSLFFGTLWLISVQVGLVSGISILELGRPVILSGIALVCLLEGVVLAYVLRAWLRQPLHWALLCGLGLLAGQAAGLWVVRSLCGPSCDEVRVQAGVLAGGTAGLIWALLAVPGLAMAVTAPSAKARDVSFELFTRAAARPPMPRWLTPVSWVVVALLACSLVLRQGLQTCGWLDRALGQSGCVLIVPGYSSVYELAVSPDGAVIVHDDRASNGTTTLQMRPIVDGAVLATLAFNDMPLQIRFSPDGQLLAAAGADGLVRVWEAANGKERYTLPVASTRVAFSPDGSTLLTTEGRWRASDGTFLGLLPPEDAGLEGIAGAGTGGYRVWSPDRSLLAEVEGEPADDDDQIVISERDSQSPGRRLVSPGGGSLSHLTFSPDGQLLAVTSRHWGRGRDDPRVLVWRVSDGALLRSIPLDSGADALAWSADSHLLLVWESFGRGAMGFRIAPE